MDALKVFVGKIEKQIINPIITLVMLAAFILFVWGVIQFIMGAGDEEKRRTGRQHMLWGIIGLTIMFGAQILLRIIGNIAGYTPA